MSAISTSLARLNHREIRDRCRERSANPSGFYYFQAAAVFLAVFPMAWFPRFAPIIFGIVASACFFVTGLKYKLRRQRGG